MIWSAALGNTGPGPFRDSLGGMGLIGVRNRSRITRVKKIAIINSVNPEWNDLAELWFADVSRNDPSLRSG